MRSFKSDHKLGSKTKLLWQNPEYREHMRQAHLGQIAWNKGVKTQTNTGRTHFKKGQVSLRKGVSLSEETKTKMSLKLKGRIILKTRGDKNWHWKGDDVRYSGLHSWIRKQLGNATRCINGHTAKRYVWANISGEYKRDLSDWHELCDGCNGKDGVRIPERFNI